MTSSRSEESSYCGELGWFRGFLGTDMEKSEEESNLRCPLCRGKVLGWKVIEEVRNYLNLKSRSCSRESCSFIGNYRELRRHARRVHPTVRPADVDPSRQRAWRRLEDQREYNDIVSTIRSAMPGAMMIGSLDPGAELRGGRSRVLPRHRRATGTFSRRRYVWGENLLGLRDDNNDNEEDEEYEADLNISSDLGDDGPPNRRRRRRLTRASSDEGQP
ncbi:UNVERIFIED_CONTAM: hypothetical protein Sradi_1271100 [Sesamum radiatum]|uniref:Uncharacterized protein n=1 Tax=Sesamum radiatum TaxID=300843 RepID=A0AAW2URB6_SESRA